MKGGNRKALVWLVCACAAYSAAAVAQPVPLSFRASPDVYKVAAENDQHRMIEGTWKPGQRDKAHGHPAYFFYWLTPCTLRFHSPVGARDVTIAAGRAGHADAVPTHEVENIGPADCKVLMFEPK